MSTGAECYFTEVKPGQYTYWLQSWPYGDNPDGQTYGPFPSFRAAADHLDRNHANPGGWSTNILPEGEHRHEWGKNGAQVARGIQMQLTLPKMALDTTPEQALEALVAGELFSGLRVWKNYVYDPDAVSCEACGRPEA